MDLNALIVKSPKGAEEIESRAHGLSHKLRGVLIALDGESSLAQILERSGEFSARVEAQIIELVQLGYALALDENGQVMQDELAADDTIPEEPAAPADMRDFSRPTKPS